MGLQNSAKRLPWAFLGVILACGVARANQGGVNIFFSSSAPAGTQATFIANTTSQCQVNYLAPNTFPGSEDMILQGCVSGSDIATVPEPDYVYGWADGATYNQYQQSLYVGGLTKNCIAMSTSTFLVLGSSASYDTHISSQTCVDVINTIAFEIYQLFTSTPAVIPGGI